MSAPSLVLIAFFSILFFFSSASLVSSRPGKYYNDSLALYTKYKSWLAAVDPQTPQQIFTARGATSSDVVITWVTFNATSSPCVTYAYAQNGAPVSCPTSSAPPSSAYAMATSRIFVDPNPKQTIRYLYTAKLSNIAPDSHIYYRVGSAVTPSSPSSAALMSEEIAFHQAPQGDQIHTMLVYGDLGFVNSRSVQLMTQEIAAGNAQSVLHVGDIAYNLDTDEGQVGDSYMNLMMPIASRVQYFVNQGNHENGLNATHFKERFSALNDLGVASGSGHNLWFSWDYISGGAKIHVAAINSEQYFISDRKQARADQYRWLDADLKAASQSADWLIVFSHRPIYCNNLDTLSDCTVDAKRLRDGFDGENNGIDELISRHHVDIFFTAHEHDYERTQPISRGQFELQSNHTVVNAKFPVTIVSGSAGCNEGLEWFDDVLYAQWSVVRSSSYGYGKLAVHNKTHLYWMQYLDEGAAGTDYLWMIKDAKVEQRFPILDVVETVASA